MKNRLLIISLFILSFFFYSCKKELTGTRLTIKTTYGNGDPVSSVNVKISLKLINTVSQYDDFTDYIDKDLNNSKGEAQFGSLDEYVGIDDILYIYCYDDENHQLLQMNTDELIEGEVCEKVFTLYGWSYPE